MTDNLMMQEFNSFFTYTMDGIMQGLCDLPSTSLYLILEISFAFHIFSLKNGLIIEPRMRHFYKR